MPVQKQRKSDKVPHKLKPFLHYLTAFVLGWHIKGWFPKNEMIIELVGDSWNWFLSAVQGLGGLAAIGSFSLIAWNIYKGVRERKNNR